MLKEIGIIKRVRKSSEKAGLPPGTPVFVGEKKALETTITIIDYDEKNVVFKELEQVKECLSYKDKQTVTWINVNGLHEVDIIDELGKSFGLHPLSIEDILNTKHRPKMELFDDYILFIARMYTVNKENNEIDIEQISIFLEKNIVITFQEKPGDVFDHVRNRIKGLGRITRQTSDYLAYSLLDSIVDNYYGVLDRINDQVEKIEEELVSNPTTETLEDIYQLKRRLIMLRKSVWPLRDIVNELIRHDNPLVRESTGVYLRDLYDHIIHVLESIDAYRDLISGMLDAYMSSVSNRMNEVMKVLTIFATIFIPLTFIAGVYGMNFRYMPELAWKWGYFGVLALMASVGISLLVYFKRKNWL